MKRYGSIGMALAMELFVSGCKSCCPFCETSAWQVMEGWWRLILG